MDRLNLSVIILSYNGLQNTLDCINSLKKAKKDHKKVEIIVVDNASVDGSREALANIKDIKLIANEKNLGFSGGMNTGIKYALKHNATHIVLLNNDTLVDENFLTSLITSSKYADIISPKIYFAPGFEFHKKRYKKLELGKVIWYAGGKIDWANILGVHLGVDEVDHGQFGKSMQTNFATGCCMLVKSEVFEKIGLLDEKYFLYLEDMDFSVRAKKNGFIIIFDPKSIIWHKNASSTEGSGSDLQDYYITRNRLIFAFKYAKLRTKLALLRQVLAQSKNETRKKALFDFLTFHYGKKR